MPLFPQFEQQYTQQVVTDTFGGYNHKLKIPDGEWYDTWNLTTDHAPMLAKRKKRGITNETVRAVLEKKALAYVDSNGDLWYDFATTAINGLQTAKPTQLVSMGAYICIFPDKKYYNTEDPTDYGDMEAHFAPTSTTYEMVRYDGTVVSATYMQPDEPANPQNAEYWIDTSGDKHVLRQWSSAQGDWVSVETVYIKVTFTGVQDLTEIFHELDGVTISGSSVEDVNGEKVIYSVGADWIMVTGLLETVPSTPDANVSIDREVPDMDYVCEAQNRLWGCFYGMANSGETVNEIYCCALGDFKNWRQYQGLSTDSWTGSVGSDGQWTGAVNYLGYPTFFKENRIHRVTISTEGAHRIDETVCRGVQKGSSGSLVVVNETLYYKSRSDVCAYQGGFPTGVSAALGDVEYKDAVAGAINSKYYISMKDTSNVSHLFVYDISKGIWLHEDELAVSGFARVDSELYAIGPGNKLYTMLGFHPTLTTVDEPSLVWQAVSGPQYYEIPENKRVSRYNIRMKMAQGASVSVYIHYDGDILTPDPAQTPGTEWQLAGTVTATSAGINHYVLPVRPRRCDHLQICIRGEGDVQVYSIAKVLEVGSDYR